MNTCRFSGLKLEVRVNQKKPNTTYNVRYSLVSSENSDVAPDEVTFNGKTLGYCPQIGLVSRLMSQKRTETVNRLFPYVLRDLAEGQNIDFTRGDQNSYVLDDIRGSLRELFQRFKPSFLKMARKAENEYSGE